MVLRQARAKAAAASPPFLPEPGDVALLKASRAVALDGLAAELRTRLSRAARSREAV